MGCYINRTDERVYGAIESQYGQARTVGAADRLRFSRLVVREEIVRGQRRDKTGTRTKHAPHPEIRSENRFEIDCYFARRLPMSPADAMTMMVEASLGGNRVANSAAAVTVVGQGGKELSFGIPHGLSAGQGVRFRNEVRFVRTVLGPQSVELCAPFESAMQAGEILENAITIWPGDKPKPFTMADYWTPTGVLDRVLAGCVVEEMTVKLNSDFHGATFRGTVREVVAAEGFTAGAGGLSSFPAEPALNQSPTMLVPGHIGRMYFGGNEYYVLDLSIGVKNNADTNAREFGQRYARCFSADVREVEVGFSLYASDEAASRALHATARAQQATTAMVQMGNKAGELVGIYLPSVVLSIPAMGEKDSRVVMSYGKCVGYGAANDEISVAFA